jgi:hypothetical protein
MVYINWPITFMVSECFTDHYQNKLLIFVARILPIISGGRDEAADTPAPYSGLPFINFGYTDGFPRCFNESSKAAFLKLFKSGEPLLLVRVFYGPPCSCPLRKEIV